MSKTIEGDIFSHLIEQLLSGAIICEVTAETLYKYLQDPIQQQEVDSYLRRIGRVLARTQDNAAYFAAYRTLSNTSVKNQIKKQFSEAMNELEPMVRWLRLAACAEKNGAVLRPGDSVRGSQLLQAIENAPALLDELARLSNMKLFFNNNTEPKKQLDFILKRLCNNAYLISKGASGSVFIATGKFSRLYEILQFIASHERLDPEEDAPEQTELLH